jgi:DNA-binding LacI/PurR family transcriptional regulator
MADDVSRRAPDRTTGTPRRRPTLQDIADAAGVSPGLVSMVLRGRSGPSAATAAKVTEVAERLGYRANRTASQLASRRTHLLGVTTTPGNPYHGELVEEIQARADARGYDLLIAAVTRTHDEQRSVETLVDSNCEALVLLNPIMPPETLLRVVGTVPTVVIGRPLGPEAPKIDVVRSADHDAMELLVDHLASLGHTRIAHVDGGDLYLPAERARGYRTAMQARGLDPLVVPGGETVDAGARAAKELFAHSGITAVVAYNDQCAIGVMDHLSRTGVRVPDDVSVTGFDDDRLAGLAQIDLTTINPSQHDQAHLAADLAMDRAEGATTRRQIKVAAAHLTVRGSTAPAPVTRMPRRKGAARA